jgi:hypothetical protein
MFKKKYVVAGNLGEYNDFMYRHRDTPNEVYVYVDSADQLKGMINIEGYYVGTYYKRHDIGEIKEVIRISKLYVNNGKPVYVNIEQYTAEPVIPLYNNHVIDYRYKQIAD